MSAHTAAGKPPGFERHHTVKDLARFFGKSERTIERWYGAGTIPAPDHVTEAGWKLWSPQQVTEIFRDRKKD